MTRPMENAGIVPEIGIRHRIAIARDVAGMKQVDLASAIGVSRSTVASIEQGVREPRRGEVIAISFATGVSLQWLETGKTPAGNDPRGGEEVRHQGLEPRTH
ncbi:helix-turn-helix transcriptional regulator [Corynebacterium diphtheriae]|nr:helix-turn-helix transcriptional regulator [Corynebacterium diphtheriae]UWE74795.1 helix-turn-helix domain-containing protein [Corynebacterium diphtheriae bv. gravis]UWE80846.1 helix-turn-helix domain-containing protein [Corynebacterium diphtheriae bv. gravis]UWE93436.1 helix-turn-helix domain-containing protein [Corynebacterium diphtheriae bv. gravis]UWF09187.1 helix-turn-helix domain-containing protein [Corynebacterium diphtheriae bv. gravis]UWF14631.1 helix-turn-helix domain-containing p